MPANSVPGTGSSRPALTICPSASATQSLRPVHRGQASQHGVDGLVGYRLAEHLRLHRGHRADVCLCGDLSQLDPGGQLDVDGQQPRLADHDRLRLLRLEPVPEECVVEPRCVVVPSGLPLHALDRRVVAIVGDRLLDQSLDGSAASAPPRSRYGHKATATGEMDQPERAEPRDLDGARGLDVGSKLGVVGMAICSSRRPASAGNRRVTCLREQGRDAGTRRTGSRSRDRDERGRAR